MNKYIWQGININGKSIKGITFANSVQELEQKLLKQKIALINYKIKKENLFKKLVYFNSKVSLKNKVFFFEQLSLLLNGGIELLKALKLVEKQIQNKKLKKIIKKIITDITQGKSFSQSLKKYKTIFDASITNSIAVGENADKLPEVIDKIAQYQQKTFLLKSNLAKAALMPLITFIFSLLIIFAIFIFVIPQFEQLFNSMEKTLPSTTLTIIAISHFLQSQYFVIYAALFLFFLILCKLILKTQRFKKIIDKIKLSIYPINKIIILKTLISYLNLVSLSLKSGIAIDKALEYANQTVKNSYLKQIFVKIKSSVVQGKTLKASINEFKLKNFPSVLSSIISIGEETGNLDLMLEKASIVLQKQFDSFLSTLTKLFQPTLIIIIGLIIVIMMISIYLPIFDMANIL